MSPQHKKIASIISAIFLAIVIFLTTISLIFIDNRTVEFEFFKLTHSNTLGEEIVIVHISDTHFPRISVDIHTMLKDIESKKPDIIAITGDIIDGGVIAESGVFEFIKGVVQIAPVFYVDGNHENNHSDVQNLYDFLESKGVVFLRDKHVTLNIRGAYITIVGLLDCATSGIEYTLPHATNNHFIITLVHRPNRVSRTLTENTNFIAPDLVLAGHVHGGQWRIFGRGLLCPDTIFFPRYQAGLYQFDTIRNTRMIVSRGLGNSIVPFRFNNRPHIPVITVAF